MPCKATLEPFMAGWNRFCLSAGAAIRQEGGAVPMWRIGQAADGGADKQLIQWIDCPPNGARQRETLRAG